MRIVVAGSSGLVRSRLVWRFKNRGEAVIGVDREPGMPTVFDQFVQGDLAKRTVRQRALEGADAVVHLVAAKDRS